jgi:1-acylglycerone phosphate reductase
MEVDLQEARQIFETNFFAVILMCQTFLPLLLKAKGSIVQIGSVSGVSTAAMELYVRDHVDCSR